MNSLVEENGCPICNSKLKRHNLKTGRNSYMIICTKNECFVYQFLSGYLDIFVFNKKFHHDTLIDLEISEEVINEINYWKENERYLMKLLEK